MPKASVALNKPKRAKVSEVSVKMTLRDILAKAWFARMEAAFLSQYDLRIESAGPDGREVRSLSSALCHPYFCRLIRDSRPATARCYRNRRRWMCLARKSGRPHVDICHAGIMLACVPVVYRGKLLGGMFYGKCLADNLDKLLRQDIRRRFKGYHFYWFMLYRAMRKLEVVGQKKLVRAGEFLQSQLKRALVPEKVAALRENKKRRRVELAVKRKRLHSTVPVIDESSPVCRAMDYMNYHYDLPITLKELAAITDLSVFHFAHQFRRQTGVTPIEYLTRVRIHHAKRLLAMPEYNYNQIMEATGYTYQSYFIRMFKRVTGTTPQKFRMRKQGSQQVSAKCKRKRIH